MVKPVQALKSRVKQIRAPILGEWIDAYFAWRYQMAEARKLRAWIAADKAGPPPPLYKQGVVRSFGRRFGLATFIETGTFEGKMVTAVKRDFRKIFTIELDPTLSAEATKHFREDVHIIVMEGDSAQVLPRVLAVLEEPALFWLDAHYSGGQTARGNAETPIMHELSAIAEHSLHLQHVLLIDDAREFVGGAYPTLDGMRDWARTHGYDTLLVQDDIIRIYRAAAQGTEPATSPRSARDVQ